MSRSSLAPQAIILRFNTRSTGPQDRWRVFVNGEEHQCRDFLIRGCELRSVETLEQGVTKFNVGCEGYATFRDGLCTVEPVPPRG